MPAHCCRQMMITKEKKKKRICASVFFWRWLIVNKLGFHLPFKLGSPLDSFCFNVGLHISRASHHQQRKVSSCHRAMYGMYVHVPWRVLQRYLNIIRWVCRTVWRTAVTRSKCLRKSLLNISLAQFFFVTKLLTVWVDRISTRPTPMSCVRDVFTNDNFVRLF